MRKNREIKFRAWGLTETGKQMNYDPHISIHVSSTIDVFVNGYFKEGRFLALMQYTGLKDKNGKEIYEGDIVKTALSYPKAQIVWCNNEHEGEGYDARYCAELLSGLEDLEEPEFSLKRGNHIELCHYIADLEVIGNIYENKELLNDKA